jgi:protein involved in polysaccharide export with SLBB domain
VPILTGDLKARFDPRSSWANALLLWGLALAVAALGCSGGRGPSPPPFTANGGQSAEMVPEIEAYRVLVNDELTLTVLGNAELSGPARVLPDGTITVPGVGSVYVLGLDLTEITQKVTEQLAQILRFPRASVAVTRYGERRIFVMGEVVIPGDHEYHRGMSALSAIAEAGGFKNTAKTSSVLVLRRLGPEEMVAFRVDLRDALKGKNLGRDLLVKPFDIVYVPKTFIASVNVLMDQYFRQLTPPFSLYYSGWQAFHLGEATVRFVTY